MLRLERRIRGHFLTLIKIVVAASNYIHVHVLRSKDGRVVTLVPSTSADPGLHPEFVCGLRFSPSQPNSEGFSLGTPVFLPPQN